MREINKTMLKMTERIVRITAERERKGWPPICPTLLHQPKRPSSIRKEEK